MPDPSDAEDRLVLARTQPCPSTMTGSNTSLTPNRRSDKGSKWGHSCWIASPHSSGVRESIGHGWLRTILLICVKFAASHTGTNQFRRNQPTPHPAFHATPFHCRALGCRIHSGSLSATGTPASGLSPCADSHAKFSSPPASDCRNEASRRRVGCHSQSCNDRSVVSETGNMVKAVQICPDSILWSSPYWIGNLVNDR